MTKFQLAMASATYALTTDEGWKGLYPYQLPYIKEAVIDMDEHDDMLLHVTITYELKEKTR